MDYPRQGRKLVLLKHSQVRKQIWFVYTMVIYQVTGKKVDHSYFVKEGEDHGEVHSDVKAEFDVWSSIYLVRIQETVTATLSQLEKP